MRFFQMEDGIDPRQKLVYRIRAILQITVPRTPFYPLAGPSVSSPRLTEKIKKTSKRMPFLVGEAGLEPARPQ